MSEELPFELFKYHKKNTINRWKTSGLIETDETILEIYEGYIRASHCELCGNPFKSSKDRCMDHCHETGKFRNIVCNKCNVCKSDKKFNNNTGYRYISKKKSKGCKQGFYYSIQISRNGKYVFTKATKTLEEAIELRDKFIAEHPEYFS